MKMNIRIITIALLCWCLHPSAFAQGSVVFNGGFDSDSLGWALSNVTGGFGWSPEGGNPSGCIQLSGGLTGPPTASQTVTGLVPGTVYALSGAYQKMKGESTAPSFGVAVNGVYLFTAASTQTVDLTWYNFSIFYTATAATAGLDLSSGLNGTQVSYAIDNIVMQPIPEPAARCLLLLGGGLLTFFRKSGTKTGLHPDSR